MFNTKGNALFLILIAVALFAALSYAITQSGRGGGNTDKEESLIQAAQLTQYTALVRSAVDKLTLFGCGNEGISFHHSNWGHTDYQHSSPVEASCNVFDDAGGGVYFPDVDDNISNLQWEFNSRTRVRDVGTTETELIMFLAGLSEEVCQNINDGLGHGFSSVPEDAGDLYTPPTGRFDGNYTTGDNITGPSNGCPDVLCGLRSACFQEVDSGELYIYYETLVER